MHFFVEVFYFWVKKYYFYASLYITLVFFKEIIFMCLYLYILIVFVIGNSDEWR